MCSNKMISIILAMIILIYTPVCSFAENIATTASDTSVSSNEKEADVVGMLGSDMVFMASNGKFFAGGTKHDYSLYGSDAYLLDETLMVDLRVLEYAFDTQIAIDGCIASIYGLNFECKCVDDAYFLAPAEIGKALSKYVYTDNRGFVLLSDTDRGYTNSTYSHDNQEETDIIWRYMQFDRPLGDELLDRLKNSGQYHTHPRLWVRSDDISKLCSRINSDSVMTGKKRQLFSVCDGYLNDDPIVPKLDGIRLFGSCYNVKERLIRLCTAYLLAEDENKKTAYAERAWEELDSACNWDNWNLENHFLDSGEIGPGIAFAYDVLYDYLDDTQKKSVRSRVNDLYLEYCEGIYKVPHEGTYDAMEYRNTRCNWGAVCATSMLMISLTFMDEEDENSELVQRCKYIAENSLQTLEHIVTALSPYGNWDEGIGYWEYVMQHLAWSFLSLDNIFGTDFNFLSAPGVSELADYGMYNQTSNGSFNKANTTMSLNAFAPEAFIYASLYDNGKMGIYNEFYNKVDSGAFLAEYLLFFNPQKAAEKEAHLPLDTYYPANGNASFRGSWDSPDSVYVGMSGGKTTEYNDTHYDKGSFIFEALGERWSIDMGRNGNDTMPYLLRTETHSALVINPDAKSFGQSFDAHTYVESFVTKPRGAMAVYNLTDAYGDYVTSYKRGFFLGDERNTLVIRDELSLNGESELSWNMITGSDIEISDDKKSAYLLQNGKRLLVTASSSSDDWYFEKRDLTPCGGWVEGEGGFSVSKQKEFATGMEKLVLTAYESGDAYIEVKLAPVIEGEHFDEASCVPMSEWSVPDGKFRDTIICNGFKNGDVINSSVPFVIPVTLSDEFEQLTLYANGNPVHTIYEKSPDCTYNLVLPAEAFSVAGEVVLTIEAVYDNYSLNKNLSVNVCKEGSLNTLALVDFSKYPDGEPTTANVRSALGLRYIELKNGYGEISKSEYDGSTCLKFSLIKTKDSGSGTPYIQLDKTIPEGEIVHLSFDAAASKNNLSLYLAMEKAYYIFGTGGKFFETSDVSYIPGEFYHVEFVADTLNDRYAIYITDSSGKLVASKHDLMTDDTYDGEFRLSFGTTSGDDGYFLIDNMKIETSDYIQINDTSYSEEGKYFLNTNIYSNYIDDFSSYLKYVGFYDGDGALIDIYKYETDENNSSKGAYDLPDKAEYVKTFFWTEKKEPVSYCKKISLQNIA